MEIRELPIDEVVLDPDLNLRDHLDDAAIERYADAWGLLPPVTVFEVDGRWLLADGFHRVAAGARLGRRSIAAEVREGSRAEALDFASGANLAHGLPMTRAERRRAVEVKLRLHAEWSDRRLAEELGVGRDLVGRVRKGLVDAGEIPAALGRVGADGKTYTSAGLPRDPNEHAPRDRLAGGQDDPRDRGGREADDAPWDDTRDPLPREARGPRPSPPWEDDADPKAIALAPPVEVAAPTIDEMLGMMTRQVMEVVAWSEAEGFAEAYRSAGADARSRFETSARTLAGRVDTLRSS